jgi:hypothetical protein
MLTLEQLPLLTSCLSTEAIRSDPFGPLHLGLLELVESTSNRLPVDAELRGQVSLVLASTNAATDSLYIRVGQLGFSRRPRLSLRGTFGGTYPNVR